MILQLHCRTSRQSRKSGWKKEGELRGEDETRSIGVKYKKIVWIIIDVELKLGVQHACPHCEVLG